jgi:hypothetical protein
MSDFEWFDDKENESLRLRWRGYTVGKIYKKLKNQGISYIAVHHSYTASKFQISTLTLDNAKIRLIEAVTKNVKF